MFSKILNLKYLLLYIIVINLVLSVFNMKNYGVHWDDEFSIEVAKVNSSYIFGENSDLLTFQDRDYGPVIELVAFWTYKLIGNNNYATHIKIRHLEVLFIYAVGLLFFYLLMLEFGISINISIFGLLFFILSPRIYGNSYYNSKDIPLMVGYILVAFTLVRLLRNFNFKYLLFHSISSALLIDIRIVGIIAIPFTIFFVLFFLWKKELKLKQVIIYTPIYLVLTSAIVVAFWPYLWSHPIDNFALSYLNMQHFRWYGTVRFAGELIEACDLPYIYLPWSILITVTFPQAIIGIISLVFSSIVLFKVKNIKTDNHFKFLLAMMFFALPIAVIIYKESIVYDSWRHIYFTYPFLILLSLLFLNYLNNTLTKYRQIFNCVLVITILFPMFQMAKNNPYQAVYFNSFAKLEDKPLYQQYDMDYWGVYYKKALQYLMQHTSEKQNIKVSFNNLSPGFQNVQLVNSELGYKKFDFKDKADLANYYVSNFRDEFHDLTSNEFQLIKSFEVEGEVFMSVYVKRK